MHPFYFIFISGWKKRKYISGYLTPLFQGLVHGASSHSKEARLCHLIRESTEVFSNQTRDKIPPTSPESAPGPPPGRTGVVLDI